MLEIVKPETPDQFDAVRRLCWAYRDFLLTVSPESRVIAQTFYPEAKYAAVMDRLEQEYRPPMGGMRLALRNGAPVGCGMFHTLEPGVAEIKRVWLNEDARGIGAGYALMTVLVEDCRAGGFRLVRMDTGRPLVEAQRLYDSMGFARRDPYYQPPEIARRFLVFFEMELER